MEQAGSPKKSRTATRCVCCGAYLPIGKGTAVYATYEGGGKDSPDLQAICTNCLNEMNRRYKWGEPLWDMEHDRRPLWLPERPSRSF